MKIKEILCAAARLSGREDAAAFFAGEGPDNAGVARMDAAFLRTALSLAAAEIADRRGGTVVEEEIFSEGGWIPYGKLTHVPLRLLSVNGCVPDKRADGFFAARGTVRVRYERRAEVRGDDEEVDLPAGTPPAALVYYVAAECAAKDGNQDLYAEFTERYERALVGFSGKLRGARVAAGRWEIE